MYWYDAAGERTVKESFDNEGVYVNGALSGARTGTSKFTAYVSPYMVVSQGGNYTKHVYMGSQRITSKVGNSGIFTTSPVNTTDLKPKLALQTTNIKERFDSLGVKYSGVQQTGGLISSSPSGAGGTYFYHPDHLGSSSLITNGSGDLVQHIQYVPFGEVFVEERNATWSTPYKFNGKEQDEETGLCYYGARYYDPRTSVWLSVDPLAEKYFWTSSYIYCLNSPVKYIDPDGRSTNVTKNGDGTYTVVGGNLNDEDKGIYVGTQDDKGNFKRTSDKPIGETTSMTTFYNDDKKDNGSDKGWMGRINPNDDSGKKFLANIMYDTPTLSDYIPNARNGEKYDFKSTNGTDKKIYSTDQEYYRGMPMGTSENGLTVYSSARDIGNMGAGYVSGANGLIWSLARLGFDLYNFKQNGIYPEGSSTQNPELIGWKLGHSRLVNEIKKYRDGSKKIK